MPTPNTESRTLKGRIIQTCIRYPPAPGGAETHVQAVSEGLVARGWGVEIFTSDLYKEIPFQRMVRPEPHVNGIPVKRFRSFSPGGELHYVLMPPMLRGFLKEGADLIHGHSYGYFQNNAAAFMKKLKRVPFVLTPHFHPAWSMWGGETRRRVRKVYDKVVAKPVLRAVDRVIGVSRHEIELMRQALDFDESKVRYIPNGIHLSRFEPVVDRNIFAEEFKLFKRSDIIQNIEHIVLYAGRLASNKGLHVLVDAAVEVVDEFPGTLFLLVGEDTGMKEALERQMKDKGIRKHFLFTGHVHSDETFLSAFSLCDVFVLPSEYEAFGIVLLEAMASYKPCIGTRVGGVPEVIEDGRTGVIVDYDNHIQLADALTGLLKSEDRRSGMGKRGRERAVRHFSWDRIVEEIEKVYLELL